MGAQPVTIQPRQKPPKPKDRKASQQAAIDAADILAMQAKAAGEEGPAVGGAPKEAEPLQFESGFPDPVDAVPLPAGVTLPPAALLPPVVATTLPEPQISNVDLAAGIPDPRVKESIDSPTGAKLASDAPRPMPPHTAAQWLQQQRGEAIAYPEVTDVFMGRIPGEKSINVPGGFQKKPEAPAPVVREVIVTHEPPPMSAAYVTTRKFVGYLGDSFVELDKGQVIYEPYVVEELLRGGFDGLQPVDVAASFLTCPACNHQFPAEAGA